MSDHALLIVDIQNDYFPGGRYLLSGIEEAACKAQQVLAFFRKNGRPVIHVRHEFPADQAPFFAPGTEGARIHESVRPFEGETVILKHYPNSFRETPLKEVLERQKVKKLTIIGSMSHVCIDATTRAASDKGYDVTVLHDCVATTDLSFNGVNVPAKEVHAAFMAALAFAYAKVISTQEFLGQGL